MPRLMACALVLAAVAPAAARPDPDPAPADGVGRVSALVEEPNLPRDLDPVWAPPFVTPPRLNPAVPPSAVPALSPPSRFPLTDFRLSQTYLPKLGQDGFGNLDTEFAAQVALPGWEPLGKPLLLKGGWGIHLWDGPSSSTIGTDPGLPGAVYDLYLDLGWKPRPAEWLFLDLGLTPGLYTDFHAIPSEAFRLKGRFIAMLALSEKFQFVGGVLYVNRLGPKVIPAGGFRWVPNDDTLFQVVFPQPKIARRVGSVGGTDCWVYGAGEFGGGTWAYQRPDGSAGAVDLNDYRVLLGTELKRADGWLVRAEVGYVWGRELESLNRPLVTPGDAVLVRLALIY